MLENQYDNIDEDDLTDKSSSASSNNRNKRKDVLNKNKRKDTFKIRLFKIYYELTKQRSTSILAASLLIIFMQI